MYFVDTFHAERFSELCEISGRSSDRERLPLFYILSAFDDIFNSCEDIYDLHSNSIMPESMAAVEYSYNSHAALVELGCHLYNSANPANVCEILMQCGSRERLVALEAIKIRFGMEA